MRALSMNELRERFLVFFEKKSHTRLPSFSLIPHNDKSLLIIGSGMAPMKPYFTGQETPPNRRVATCQKCVRTTDIDEVGLDARHISFIEMLGNFSFGDYFKEEAITWAWDFLTNELNIPEEKLFVSIFLDDDEAHDIWTKKVGLPAEKIVRLGREDNFWEHGIGPCGPSSEIHFDKGPEWCDKPDCKVGCGCDRFMEVWNLVFTQFNKEEDGSYTRLEKPSIDTGMGLERLGVVIQSAETIFDLDTMIAIRDAICAISGVKYNTSRERDVSIKIITDHIRSVTFMTADGILPSNEGRGYVLRRLIRRASMHGRRLGIERIFLADVAAKVIDIFKGAYPELIDKKDYILKVLAVEEGRFHETLGQGMEMIAARAAKLKEAGADTMPGADAFKLYDTYGFPLELLKEILADEGLGVDEDGFGAAMKEQKHRARSARGETDYTGADKSVYDKLPAGDKTVFTGYDSLTEADATILHIIRGDEIVNEAREGDEVSIVTDKTPLYAESGGQRGDGGTVATKNGTAAIHDCVKIVGDRFAILGKLLSGTIAAGETARINADAARRAATARNHTATHLLHRALKDVLGGHVEQAGSQVGESLRFDFTHYAPLTHDELRKVESIINEKILAGLGVTVEMTDVETARKKGAAALFGEKYGASVRMVGMADYSIELCGGTHLVNTALCGMFKIISENGIAAGVRRIEALTGDGAINYFNGREEEFIRIGRLLKASPDQVVNRLESLLDEHKNIKAEAERLRAKISAGVADAALASAEDMRGSKIVTANIDGCDMAGLRTVGDRLREKISSGVVLLASGLDGKVNIFVTVTDDLVKAGLHAGDLAKGAAIVCGGGGGGGPNAAQAGGKDASKIGEALSEAKKKIAARLA